VRVECPLRPECERICDSEPRYLSYHPERENEKPECYLNHMILCSESFGEKYGRLKSSIVRVLRKVTGCDCLSGDIVERVMRGALAVHDVGKLTREYQGGKTWMRHELLGFYLLLETGLIPDLVGHSLPEDVVHALKGLTSVAVYIMHEAYLIKYDRGWLRFPSATDLLNDMRGWSYNFIGDYPKIIRASFRIFGLDDSPIDNLGKISNINAPQLINAILKTSRISYGPSSPSVRLAVASITKLIKDVDDEAASRGRRGRQCQSS
jgi:hypothetical protein